MPEVRREDACRELPEPPRRIRRALRAAAIALLAACALTAGQPADAAPPAAAFRWVRETQTPERTVRLLASAAAERGCDAMVVVFDLVTFDPPAGSSVWSSSYMYQDDLAAWFAALETTAAAGRMPVFAAATTSSRPVRVEGRQWAQAIRDELGRRWWDDRRFKRFETAEHWARRLVGTTPGKLRALVLVASEFPPELPREQNRRVRYADWRRKLLQPGDAFDEERVGATVAARGGVFFAVAPEVSFGDFLPVQDLPQFPWVLRPSALPGGYAVGGPSGGRRGGGTAPGGRDGRPRGGDRPGGRVPAPRGPVPGLADETDPGGRFHGATPAFQRRAHHLVNADSPSGYGFWPYARAAAKTGGAYFFYPFPESPWADDCPRDEPLVDALAPEMVRASELERRLRADPVTEILARAQRLVFDDTPWSDSSNTAGWGPPGHLRGAATSWFGFEMRQGLRPAVTWVPRDVPMDTLGGAGTVQDWKDYGIELARTAVRYDAALEVLEDGARDLEKRGWKGVSRRSRANLRLARFWCAESGFHMHALSNYLTTLDRWMPDPAPDGILVTAISAFKLSDRLDAWDDRTISWEQERAYGWESPFLARGGQGNFLAVPPDDPNYRARRDLDCVLLHLDPSLVGRAVRVVEAARDVMRHEGRSGWGWVTYYAEAETFIWEPAPPPPKGPVKGGGSKDKGPKTPSGPTGPEGPRTGGSSGGGSSTK